jgi:von Willebrand factor type A domain/Putative Flp pilus-assembly TadE/G-like
MTTKRQKGFVSVYLVFSSFLLIPMAGLAIDFSVLYSVKGRLQAAVDAAAIGAGSMLQRSTNLTDPVQLANIQNAAQRFFNADYPPGYWGSQQVYYSSTPAENALTRVRTIYVHAEESVPMLFMRVLGIKSSMIAAQATSSVRFVTMMIVVDRSGSVVNGGAVSFVQSALTTFIANSASSAFVNGRDVVGMGSFSGDWKLDFAPTTSFQSSTPNIGTAINNIPFTTLGNTNTAEGLHQAYAQLQSLNDTGALNVILLLTDGRPSGFTSTFPITGTSTCTNKTAKLGFIASYVGIGTGPGGWPPPQTGAYTYGVYQNLYANTSPLGTENSVVAGSSGCAYNSTLTNLPSDVTDFPTTDAYGNSTTGPVYQGEGTNTSDPRAVRYASFNAADNMARTIRLDSILRPVLFVIGLNETSGEPLDEDWLGRVANDPNYRDTNGNPVFQTGQTAGIYINTNTAGLSAAFQTMASQILRLSQ